jgi:hypothetical protein
VGSEHDAWRFALVSPLPFVRNPGVRRGDLFQLDPDILHGSPRV